MTTGGRGAPAAAAVEAAAPVPAMPAAGSGASGADTPTAASAASASGGPAWKQKFLQRRGGTAPTPTAGSGGSSTPVVAAALASSAALEGAAGASLLHAIATGVVPLPAAAQPAPASTVIVAMETDVATPLVPGLPAPGADYEKPQPRQQPSAAAAAAGSRSAGGSRLRTSAPVVAASSGSSSGRGAWRDEYAGGASASGDEEDEDGGSAAGTTTLPEPRLHPFDLNNPPAARRSNGTNGSNDSISSSNGLTNMVEVDPDAPIQGGHDAAAAVPAGTADLLRVAREGGVSDRATSLLHGSSSSSGASAATATPPPPPAVSAADLNKLHAAALRAQMLGDTAKYERLQRDIAAAKGGSASAAPPASGASFSAGRSAVDVVAVGAAAAMTAPARRRPSVELTGGTTGGSLAWAPGSRHQEESMRRDAEAGRSVGTGKPAGGDEDEDDDAGDRGGNGTARAFERRKHFPGSTLADTRVEVIPTFDDRGTPIASLQSGHMAPLGESSSSHRPTASLCARSCSTLLTFANRCVWPLQCVCSAGGHAHRLAARQAHGRPHQHDGWSVVCCPCRRQWSRCRWWRRCGRRRCAPAGN